MTTRNALGLTAAGALTFAAVLLGSGHTFAQEPTASPAPAASPAAMMDVTNDGMSGMDAQDMASMMGTMMGHMMASMMSEMTGGLRMHGSDMGDQGPSMGHDPQGMGGSGAASDHQACLDMMNEMKTMMAGSMMGGQGPDSSPGMGMGDTQPAPSTGPAASPAADGVDDASHHPAPSASPGA